MGLFDRRGGGMSPMTMALVGLLAYRTLKGKGRLADILGMNNRAGGAVPGAGQVGASGGGLGGLGNLGGLGGLGGLAGAGGLGALLGGGGLANGLKDLLDRFRQAGHEQKAQSWVSTGVNEPLDAKDLEQALGEERIDWLVEQTGLSRDELLAKLSSELPSAVDELTPEGRVPSDDELARRVNPAG